MKLIYSLSGVYDISYMASGIELLLKVSLLILTVYRLAMNTHTVYPSGIVYINY